MSNFICSECGMTNIDCGHDGYKTPKEIELEKKVHILNEANMKLENELGHFADLSKTIDQFADLSKKVERLQEQLQEATELLCDQVNRDEKWDGGFDIYQLRFIEKMGCYTNEKGEYVLPDKWGVK